MIKSFKKYLFRKFKEAEVDQHELSYLFWECTTRCNLDCLHCGSDCSKTSDFDDMPLQDLMQALDTIIEPSPNLIVVITGGEPLVRSDLERCGKAIRDRGFSWSIVSNGHNYSRERHISLLNSGLGALTFSLDGLKESHNWLRNNSSSFDRVSDAIDLASSCSHLNFDIVTCVNQRNIEELHELKEFLISKGVKAWRFFTIVPIGRAVDNPQLHLSDKQFVSLMEFIKEARAENIIDIKFSCEGYVGRYEADVRDTPFFCRAGVNIGSILIDGSISACPNIDRSLVQGNIYKDNFFQIWSSKFSAFRDRSWTKRGQCASCDAYRNCQGNGLHNWHGAKDNVLICHHNKIEQATLS